MIYARYSPALILLCVIAFSLGGQTAALAADREPAPEEGARAEPGMVEERPMTLEECIAAALANNISLLNKKLSVFAASEDVNTARSEFDPAFFGGVGVFDLEDYPTMPVRDKFQETQGHAITGGMTGKCIFGTRYTINIGDVKTDLNILGMPVNPTEVADFAIELRQPLWRGWGKTYNLANLIVARVQVKIGARMLEAAKLDVAINVVNTYWGLVLAREELAVAREHYKRAEDLLRITTERVNVGELAPVERTRAEAGLAARENLIFVLENAIASTEDLLKFLISPSENPADWDFTIIPTDEPTLADFDVDLAVSLKMAVDRRPELKGAELGLKAAEIIVKKASDDRKPQVDLTARYTAYGTDGNLGNALDRLNKAEQTSVELGIELSYPLGNRYAKSLYAKARLARDSAFLAYRTTRNAIIMDVRGAARDIESAKKRIEANRKAVTVAEEVLRAEQARFDAQLSTNFEVLRTQDDLADAEKQLLQAIIEYNLAVVALKRADGSLLSEIEKLEESGPAESDSDAEEDADGDAGS